MTLQQVERVGAGRLKEHRQISLMQVYEGSVGIISVWELFKWEAERSMKGTEITTKQDRGEDKRAVLELVVLDVLLDANTRQLLVCCTFSTYC